MMSTLLTHTKLPAMGVLPQRAMPNDVRVHLADPAIHTMTDFTREYPVTIEEERPIGAALADMVRLGVRAMLVARDQKVVGFITSYDIEGERPLQYLQNSNYTRHRDLQVGHIMTPWAELRTSNWRAVKNACVGDLLEAFRHVDAMHLLVVETAADDTTYVRGLFSKTRLDRQLGLSRTMSA